MTATAPSVGGDTSVAKLAANCACRVRRKLSRSGTNPPRLIVAPTYVSIERASATPAHLQSAVAITSATFTWANCDRSR